MRAVAAFMVFLSHIELPDKLPPLAKWPLLFMDQGQVGVAIFFVLSGFLITIRYANSIQLTGPWFRSYLQNRFARIYPIYFILTIISLIVMGLRPAGQTPEWYEFPLAWDLKDKVVGVVLNLSLTRAFFNDMGLLGIPTAWSLTVEETFYVAAPFLLLGLKRNMRRLLLYPILLLGTGVVLVVVCSRFSLYGFMANLGFMAGWTFFGWCVEFIAGIGLALWIARPTATEPRRNGLITWLGWGGILSGMVALTVIGELSSSMHHANVAAMFMVRNVLLSVPVAMLFWGLIKEQTLFRKLLETKTFDLLGKSSYVFYLIHLGTIDTFFSEYASDHWLPRLVFHTLLSIALYKWVEHPLHQLLRAKKPVAQPVLQPAEMAV